MPMRPSALLRRLGIGGLDGTGIPGAGAVVRWAVARGFGPPPLDPARARGDPGLLGPGSATWKLLADPSVLSGGIRGLMVQLLHPGAMAGVADHSSYRDDPLDRLQRTAAYVTVVGYGSLPEALEVTRTVRRVHEHVVGRTPAGVPYRAGDPDLLAWVSVALTASFLANHDAYAGWRLTAAERDAFVAEQSRTAALLDPRLELDEVSTPAAAAALRAGELVPPMLREGRLPTTEAGLRATLADYRDELEVNHQGRETLRFLLDPDIPRGLRLGYRPLAEAARATLEPYQQQLLGLERAPGRDAAARLALRQLFRALRAAAGPSLSYRMARRRVAAGSPRA